MQVIETELEGVLILEPKVFGDSRGFFLETFREQGYREAGIVESFVQDNHSRSSKGVLRGLHFQTQKAQGKLVRVSRGKVFDVAADVNPLSPTFGKYVGVMLDDEIHRQLYIPPGYAHGFCVLSDVADFEYKCTEYYCPEFDAGVIWSDPDLNIDWPIQTPLLSEKDTNLPSLKEYVAQ